MESEADFDGEDVFQLAAFNGIIECEPPNNKLGRFNGKERGDYKKNVSTITVGCL